MDADLVQRLLNFKPEGMIEVRDKAIAELLYSSGLLIQGTKLEARPLHKLKKR